MTKEEILKGIDEMDVPEEGKVTLRFLVNMPDTKIVTEANNIHIMRNGESLVTFEE